MPDDIAKIGLDTADMARALDRISGQLDKQLGGAAKKADKEVKGLHASLTKMGKTALAFFGFQSFKAGINSIIRMNAEIEATRDKMVAGSDAAREFESTLSGLGENSRNVFSQAEKFLDRLILKMKIAGGKSLLGLGMMVGAVDPKEVFKKNESGGGGFDAMAEIRKLQDKQATNAIGGMDRVDALNEELHIQFKLLDYYREGVGMDRERMNSTKVRIGALLTELSTSKAEFELSEKKAKAERQHLEFTNAGYRHVGERAAIIAEFEDRITAARKEGRKELEAQLRTQRDIAIQQAKADRARETPATRRDARREARLRERDAARDEARQAEFQRRRERGVTDPAGNSPFAEFMKGVAPKEAGAGGGGMANIQATLNKIEKNTQATLSVSAVKGG